MRRVPLSYLKPAALALAATHLSVAMGILGMLPYLEQGSGQTQLAANCFPQTIIGALIGVIAGAGPNPDKDELKSGDARRRIQIVRIVAVLSVVVGFWLLLRVGVEISDFLNDFAQPAAS